MKRSPAKSVLSLVRNVTIIYKDPDGLLCDRCGYLTVARESGRPLPPGGQCIGCHRQLRGVFLEHEGQPKTFRVRPRRDVYPKSFRGGRR